MEPHGHYQLHATQGADNGAGTAGVVQKVVGHRQPPGGQLAGAGVQPLFHCGEHWSQAVGPVSVFCRRTEEGSFFLKALPPPQGEADIPAVGRDACPKQHAVGLILRRFVEDQSRVCRQQDLRLCDTHGPQLRQGVRLPQGDHVHIAVEDLGRQTPVALPGDGTDAAAVHLHLAAGPLGGCDVVEIEPQGAAGGHVLDQAAAAVDIQPGTAHGGQPRRQIGPVDRPDPVGQAGALGILAEDRHRHVRINGAHLLENGLQNGVVAGVAPAVGATDHHTVPGRSRTVVAAQNFLVNVELSVHGMLDGELGGGLLVQFFPQLVAQVVVLSKLC